MLRFFKSRPNDYVIKYVSGKVRAEGAGLTFTYWPYNTNIAVVPIGSVDAAFVFNDLTANFQQVAIQGQFTYRIVDPRLVAKVLDFSIDPRKRTYLSKDPEVLVNRITNVVQAKTHDEILGRSMEESIRESESIARAVLETVQQDPILATLGLQLLTLHVQAIRPTPEVAKALEAEYRETLLRKADEAVYGRRLAAVEEERKIKEGELATNVALEQQRRTLIDSAGENALQEAKNQAEAMRVNAEAKSEALKLELAAYKGLDPRLLAALGFKSLSEGGVERLTITSEVMSALLDSQSS
jgi:regulator of protease activity HflC (stomatin/prohibitin superfamily)